MPKPINLLLLSFVSIIMACSSCHSKKAIVQPIAVEDQAMQLLNPPIRVSYNMDSTYVLCIGAGSSKSNPLSKTYCVLDNVGNLLVEKRTIHGNVGWYNIETLLIEELPRVSNRRGVSEPVISYIKIKEVNAKSK